MRTYVLTDALTPGLSCPFSRALDVKPHPNFAGSGMVSLMQAGAVEGGH
jgi:hypothetical protein